MKPYYYRFFGIITFLSLTISLDAQALRLPQSNNIPSMAGRRLGVTDISITWNAPGVKGREGKIWGTDIAWYGYTVLGFGSTMASPWRAGADECTTISFSTDVRINGQTLAAGKYAFFIALGPDTSTLIFNKNHTAWGSYFYRAEQDVLKVKTIQQKNQPQSQERLTYTFSNQSDNKVDISLEWERWKIPFTVEVDLKATTLADIRRQMDGAIGFDPPSLQAAANWCLQNEINYDEALNWITSATDPNLGGINNFNALSTRAGLLTKKGKAEEAKTMMDQAMNIATATELHQYGRSLLAQKKTTEAFTVFEKNYKKHNGAWPTTAGMMRVYSAMGDYKKALEHAKVALTQAPDGVNKNFIKTAIQSLEAGKAL